MRFLLPFLILIVCAHGSAFARIDSGLVAWWNFCSCDATDNSGNGYDGVVMSSPLCVDGGIAGKALRFNTVDEINDCNRPGGDYIIVPVLPPLWEEGFSVTAWAQFEENRNYERIIDFGNGSGDNGGVPVWFGRVGTGTTLAIESWVDANTGVNRSVGRLEATGAIINGSLHFYCATVSPQGVMRLYVDGVLLAEKTGHRVLNVQRQSNFIARSNWCSADPDFRGILDEVRIYKRPLSPAEVAELYNYRTPASVPPFPDTTLTCGQSVVLRTQPGLAYRWRPTHGLSCSNCPTPTATPEQTTTYIADITGIDGCIISDTITVTVQQRRVELSSMETGCPGDTIVLDAGPDYDYYQWSNGSTSQTIRITASTTLSVTTKTEHGCVETSHVFTVVFGQNLSDYFQPDYLVIEAIPTGSVECRDITLTNPEGRPRRISWAYAEANTNISVPTHQFPIEIPAGGTSTFTVCCSPTHSGSFTDRIVIDGFCLPLQVTAGGRIFSDTIYTPCAPPILLQEKAGLPLLLHKPHPNPTSEFVTLQFDRLDNDNAPATCTLVSQLGIPVACEQFTPSDLGRHSECTIDVRNLAAGVYRAVVAHGGTTATTTIVVTK